MSHRVSYGLTPAPFANTSGATETNISEASGAARKVAYDDTARKLYQAQKAAEDFAEDCSYIRAALRRRAYWLPCGAAISSSGMEGEADDRVTLALPPLQPLEVAEAVKLGLLRVGEGLVRHKYEQLKEAHQAAEVATAAAQKAQVDAALAAKYRPKLAHSEYDEHGLPIG